MDLRFTILLRYGKSWQALEIDFVNKINTKLLRKSRRLIATSRVSFADINPIPLRILNLFFFSIKQPSNDLHSDRHYWFRRFD